MQTRGNCCSKAETPSLASLRLYYFLKHDGVVVPFILGREEEGEGAVLVLKPAEVFEERGPG